MTNPEDQVIQLSPRPIPRAIGTAAEYLAHLVDTEWGTKSGRTALYWHLIHVINQHARPPAGEVDQGKATAQPTYP
jgi:hypothetical protein